MDQAMFYTFSTIAQVMAGIYGLTAVFMIFIIQNIKNTIFGFSQNFHDNLKDVHFLEKHAPPLKKINIAQDIYGIKAYISKMMFALNAIRNTIPEEGLTVFESIAKSLSEEFDFLERLKIKFKVISYFSVFTIISSIILVSVTHGLSISFSIILLIIFIALTLLNILFIIKFIIRCLNYNNSNSRSQ